MRENAIELTAGRRGEERSSVHHRFGQNTFAGIHHGAVPRLGSRGNGAVDLLEPTGMSTQVVSRVPFLRWEQAAQRLAHQFLSYPIVRAGSSDHWANRNNKL